MISPPLSVYECLLLVRSTGHLESRSNKDTYMGFGIQPLQPPHNGIITLSREQWDACRSGVRTQKKKRKREIYTFHSKKEIDPFEYYTSK